MLFYIVKDSSQTSLVAHIILVRVLIENEVVTIFVNCIIGEMHAEVAQVTSQRRLVFFSRKSSKPLMVNVSPQRIHSRYKNINSKIEL